MKKKILLCVIAMCFVVCAEDDFIYRPEPTIGADMDKEKEEEIMIMKNGIGVWEKESDVVIILAKKGAICKVYGHKWRVQLDLDVGGVTYPVYSPYEDVDKKATTYYRRVCELCGKVEHGTTQPNIKWEKNEQEKR